MKHFITALTAILLLLLTGCEEENPVGASSLPEEKVDTAAVSPEDTTQRMNYRLEPVDTIPAKPEPVDTVEAGPPEPADTTVTFSDYFVWRDGSRISYVDEYGVQEKLLIIDVSNNYLLLTIDGGPSTFYNGENEIFRIYNSGIVTEFDTPYRRVSPVLKTGLRYRSSATGLLSDNFNTAIETSINIIDEYDVVQTSWEDFDNCIKLDFYTEYITDAGTEANQHYETYCLGAGLVEFSDTAGVWTRR